ncbi:hypothetical protein [Paenibacillus hexagrammi]|uniref:EXPERA domain-containing protein n=1 Tax=Paenibacillus hexagrammi TaxID=2908839 RepID=A0ABY3SJZ2_9BACL|nr:hypothetical protein [Paenibacillus sp. YPD9-1]UJF33460.1 hypothetical protein L0M14_28820 [Paenibacillus sp. YPD9-1]
MDGNTIYDTHFNGNEWFVIGVTVIAFAFIWLLPRTFSSVQTAFNMLIGIAFGLVIDHTLNVPPFDLYDLGDQTKYEIFDMMSYIMYAPFGYWFIYWYKRLRMYDLLIIPYILLWVGIALGLEWMAVKVGVFHYKHGYQLIYSFPVYLFLMSTHLVMYRTAFAQHRWERPS